MAKADKEKDNNHFKIEDRIDSVILEARRIFLSDAVDNDTAQDIIGKLWYLELTEPEQTHFICH